MAVAGWRLAAHRRTRSQRKPLVHRQQERNSRPARRRDRQVHRLQDDGPGRERSAHPDLQQAGHRVLHLAELQHGRPTQSRFR